MEKQSEQKNLTIQAPPHKQQDTKLGSKKFPQ